MEDMRPRLACARPPPPNAAAEGAEPPRRAGHGWPPLLLGMCVGRDHWEGESWLGEGPVAAATLAYSRPAGRCSLALGFAALGLVR